MMGSMQLQKCDCEAKVFLTILFGSEIMIELVTELDVGILFFYFLKNLES